MSDMHAITEVSRRIKTAQSFVAIFGALPTGDAAVKRAALRKQFGYLAKLVHPDQAPAPMAKIAAETFQLLNQLRHAAEEAISRNAYEAPIVPKQSVDTDTDVSELVSSTGTYRLRSAVFHEGDFSILYRGILVGTTPTPIVAKVSREPVMNNWLEKEAVLLGRLNDARAGTPLARIAPFLPKLLDTFLVSGEKGTRYRANVFLFVPDLVSVADIIRAYPKGLDAPQAAWVARRVFAQVSAAVMLGVVHGAITPDHVLVNPVKHEPLHVGWPHAQKGGRITHVIDRWRDLYPPEVFAKQDVDHRTDIYMAGATVLRMLGGSVEHRSLPASVPSEVARILLRCLETSPARRPQDARQLLDEFTVVVRRIWGRVYRPLSMPIQ